MVCIRLVSFFFTSSSSNKRFCFCCYHVRGATQLPAFPPVSFLFDFFFFLVSIGHARSVERNRFFPLFVFFKPGLLGHGFR